MVRPSRLILLVLLGQLVLTLVVPVRAVGAQSYPPAQTILFLPAGDSNTEGIGNPPILIENGVPIIHNELTIGYRKKLKELLTADGVQTDFVGSKVSGSATFLDAEHEGWGGYGIDKIQERVDAGMLETYQPDIMALGIGQNDVWNGVMPMQEITSKINLLVDTIHTRRPTLSVILIKPGTLQANPNMGVYRGVLDTVVQDRQTKGWQVSAVDAITALADVNATHYTLAGHEEQARLLYLEIKRILQQGNMTLPTLTLTLSPSPASLPPLTSTPSPSPTPSPSMITPTQLITPSPTNCPRHAQGDADCNGKVSITDFEVWRREIRHEVDTIGADFNGDGTVTIGDYAVWRGTFFPL